MAMECLKRTSSFILYGIKDCFWGMLALRNFWSQSSNTRQNDRHSSEPPKSLRNILCDCLVFGFLFCFPISFFFRVIMDYLIIYVMESYLEPDERDWVWIWPSILGGLFNVFWTLPLFIISRAQNYSWYQQIADIMFENTGGKKKFAQSISYEWGDQIESFVVQCLFVLQGYGMLFLPFVPEIIKHVLLILHMSLLYSLYAFEYKWIQLGWGLHKRLAYINTRWPYFFGFGLPLAIMSSYFGTYVESICIFSALFPIYVVSSTVTIDSRVQHYDLPIKFFGPASSITNCVFVSVFTRVIKARR